MLERLSLRRLSAPLPTADEQGICVGSLFTICATNGYDVTRKINFFGFCQSAEYLFEHVEDAVVSRGGEVFETECQLRSSLQECLRMTVAVPRLWGVPPELERLEHGIKSGGGIIDKITDRLSVSHLFVAKDDTMSFSKRHRKEDEAFEQLDPSTSKVFNPDRTPADPQAAAAQQYSNAKTGVWALIVVYLGYSVVQGPDSPMVRPHPAVWRLVHGVMVCYLLFLVFLLFQTVDDARLFLRHMYPELGVELPEKTYGEDCNLTLPGGGINWPAIKGTVFDEFVVAHTWGWWGKALFLRNNIMLWTISILFELMEKTFKHYLPNFNECWWDSWVLDVAICNALGIVTGMWTVRYFRSKEYNWTGLSQQPSLLAKAKRSVLQFTPYSFDDFQWGVFSSPLRFLQCLFVVCIILLFEVNCFFLKSELWVPPTNPLNTYRIFILFFMALPALKEWYEFIDSESTDIFNKLGTYAWLAVAMAFGETLVVIKFAKGLFPQPWPRHVVLAWSIFGAALTTGLAAWSFQYYVVRKEHLKRGKRKVS
ncbi:hypothetical protein N2152v2_006263 [Parachlorella kessleri]